MTNIGGCFLLKTPLHRIILIDNRCVISFIKLASLPSNYYSYNDTMEGE
jgi:hypothetical protein